MHMHHHLRIEYRPPEMCLRLRVFPPLRLPELSVSDLLLGDLFPFFGVLFPFFGVLFPVSGDLFALFAFLRALRASPKEIGVERDPTLFPFSGDGDLTMNFSFTLMSK